MRIIIRVLNPHRRRVARSPAFIPGTLYEEVSIGLPLRAERESLRTADDRAREPALRAVAVHMRLPLSSAGLSKELRLQTEGQKVAVIPHQRGIEVRKAVLAVTGRQVGRYP